MDSFFYIDKPTGITSFDVLRDMRRKLGIKKLGHTGTLDPLATGGLVVATGNYTKLISYIDTEIKTYQATIMLNGVSDSYDTDSPVTYISQNHQDTASKTITLSAIEDIFKKHFFGKISQVPPSYSALKINGKRALDRVREGEKVEMKPRQTEIFSYKIDEFNYPKLILELEVRAGTYIRSIAHDLGELLGTGGYISQLRRTKVGNLDISSAVSLDHLTTGDTLDVRDIFGGSMYLLQDEQIYRRLSDGQRVRGDFSFPENRDIFLSEGKEIRYVIEYKDGVIHPRKKIM